MLASSITGAIYTLLNGGVFPTLFHLELFVQKLLCVAKGLWCVSRPSFHGGGNPVNELQQPTIGRGEVHMTEEFIKNSPSHRKLHATISV